MVKLSQTSKMGCMSWSLNAGKTCPGSYDRDGNLVDACNGCYAKGANYRYPNVVSLRDRNQEDWKREGWVADMVTALQDSRYFRWFDSGDMYALALAEKIYTIMQQTPWCAHWLPTRMAKFAKFERVIARMNALPNVMVRFSSDSITGEFGPEHGSTIYPAGHAVPAGTVECGAYKNEGKCGPCRACWSKDVAVIAYPSHGRSMTALLKRNGITVVAA